MSALKSLSSYLFGNASKENVVELPEGELYLVQPHSIKGYSGLLYKDKYATACIRPTGQECQYKLVFRPGRTREARPSSYTSLSTSRL
ncbi:vacuolar import and degradation protein 27 [Teratosphaeria destructans]|uniref:Vacuolar import and degradation protein 27 n=1 Tax=Teratosphaeria destructans TaxID=418781 RepID=A0A9W7SWK2_9PEZI|nr:vacuolar import and degradation protein 27 [Teratosphaeria destructans]